MRKCEAKINSISIVLTILLGLNSGIDFEKESKIGRRTRIGLKKGIRFDIALVTIVLIGWVSVTMTRGVEMLRTSYVNGPFGGEAFQVTRAPSP